MRPERENLLQNVKVEIWELLNNFLRQSSPDILTREQHWQRPRTAMGDFPQPSFFEVLHRPGIKFQSSSTPGTRWPVGRALWLSFHSLPGCSLKWTSPNALGAILCGKFFTWKGSLTFFIVGNNQLCSAALSHFPGYMSPPFGLNCVHQGLFSPYGPVGSWRCQAEIWNSLPWICCSDKACIHFYSFIPMNKWRQQTTPFASLSYYPHFSYCFSK